MTFGGQAVTFVTVTRTGEPGYLGLLDETRTETTVSGCHFRPLSSTEQPETETNVSTQLWKCTAPPTPAVLAAQPTGEIIHGGVTFRIVGPPQPKYDLSGVVHHVTIVAKRDEG